MGQEGRAAGVFAQTQAERKGGEEGMAAWGRGGAPLLRPVATEAGKGVFCLPEKRSLSEAPAAGNVPGSGKTEKPPEVCFRRRQVYCAGLMRTSTRRFC